MDPNGKWASTLGLLIHQWAIAKTLTRRIGSEAVQIMQDMQVHIDRRQKNEDQYMHAMRGAGQDKAEAISQANAFVSGRISTAIAQYKRGNRDIAWAYLADAVHTVQDATSPMHEGFQEFDEAATLGDLVEHAVGEFQYPGADYSSVGTARSPRGASRRQAALEGSTIWVYDIFLQGVTDGTQRIGPQTSGVPSVFFGEDGELLLPREYLDPNVRHGTSGRLEQ